MTTSETRETTWPLAAENLKGRVDLATGGTRGIGTAIGRSFASWLGWARAVRFLCADAGFLMSARVWAINGSQM